MRSIKGFHIFRCRAGYALRVFFEDGRSRLSLGYVSVDEARSVFKASLLLRRPGTTLPH